MGKSGSIKNISVIITMIVLWTFSPWNTVKAMAESNKELTLSESGKVSTAVFSEGTSSIVPGGNIYQNVSIKNNTSRKYSIVGFKLADFELVRNDSGKIKDRALIKNFTDNVSVKLEKKGLLSNIILFNGTMNELLNNNGFKFDENKISISKDGSLEFLMTIAMNPSAGNNLQGIKANFGINFSAMSEDGSGTGTGGAGVGGTGGSSNSGGINGNGSANTNPVNGDAATEIGGPTTAAAPSAFDGGNLYGNPTEEGGDAAHKSAADKGGSENSNSENLTASTLVDTEIRNSTSEYAKGAARLIKTGMFWDTEILLISGFICFAAGLIMMLKKNKD